MALLRYHIDKNIAKGFAKSLQIYFKINPTPLAMQTTRYGHQRKRITAIARDRSALTIPRTRLPGPTQKPPALLARPGIRDTTGSAPLSQNCKWIRSCAYFVYKY